RSITLFPSMLPRPPTPTPLSLHDALPISACMPPSNDDNLPYESAVSLQEDLRHQISTTILDRAALLTADTVAIFPYSGSEPRSRSEEHTSELQSLRHLVCRLLLEKKNTEM